MTDARVRSRPARPVVDIWPLVANPDAAPLPADIAAARVAAARFADLASPALADFLLAPVSARLGVPLVDDDAVARNRLFNRFVMAQKRQWARCLVDSGLEVLFLKGFASAHTLYVDPLVRAQGDLDILVREQDLSRTIGFLSSRGFRFQPLPAGPWGMISDASFMPMVSADGACEIDIHIRPDCYPAHLSLTTGRVFGDARPAAADGLRFLTPCPEHALILCATNAAKDKFCLTGLSKVVDAIVLLRAWSATLAWDAILELAHDGRFFRPLVTFFWLLDALGAPMDAVPNALRAPPRGLRRPVFQGVLNDYRALVLRDVPLATVLWREWLLGAEPSVAWHNGLMRLKGLLRPWSGIPEGGSVESYNVLLPRADRTVRSCIQE